MALSIRCRLVSTSIHIIGARPNFMKAAPVVAALEALSARPMLVHTGQHYDATLSKVFFEQLGLPEPDRNLGVGSGSHAQQTAALMTALEKLFEDQKPSRVVVYGDINSTLAASIVASKLDIPIAHVEAGLRSFDRAMPEEINRVVTDALSSLHFTTSPEAAGHLANEGVAPDGVHFVGNPMIDTLVRFRETLDTEGAKTQFDLTDPYAVVTLHRPSNVDHALAARNVVEGLSRVATELPIILPLHPRGRATLTEQGLLDVTGLRVCEPIGYLDFMALVAGAALVLTDSGGIQEETTVLGVPCLTLRDNTERPITVEMGTNRLVGNDPDRIYRGATEFLFAPPTGRIPPLWDGRAGDRIAAVLESN
jgi:UDP-N-acetylglucosamine 2-epimerase (non-hydrolysing)